MKTTVKFFLLSWFVLLLIAAGLVTVVVSLLP